MTMQNDAPETLLEAVTYFADPDVALAFVANLRWPDGEQVCPRCGVGTLVLRNGTHGPFYGCSEFPVCRHTRKR